MILNWFGYHNDEVSDGMMVQSYEYGPVGTGEHDMTEQESSVICGYDYDEEFEMLVHAYMRDVNYITISQAAVNIACSILNVGIVTLPFVAQEVGIPIFVVVMVFIGIIAGYTSVMVVSMANEQRVRTLEDLAESAFGPRGFIVVSVIQIMFSFTIMCITLGVWADITSDLFARSSVNAWVLTHRKGQVLIGSMICFPLCLLKKSLASLRWTSYVTVVAVMGALIAMISTYMGDDFDVEPATARELCEPKGEWWAIVFISIFCYSCNQKVLMIYTSLRRRSADRWGNAVQRALVAITLLYIFFGIFGYVSKQRIDIRLADFNFFLNNENEVKFVFDPARGLLAFSLLLTVPMDDLIAVTTWRRLWSKFMKLRKCCADRPNKPAVLPLPISTTQQPMGNGSIEVEHMNDATLLASSKPTNEPSSPDNSGRKRLNHSRRGSKPGKIPKSPSRRGAPDVHEAEISASQNTQESAGSWIMYRNLVAMVDPSHPDYRSPIPSKSTTISGDGPKDLDMEEGKQIGPDQHLNNSNSLLLNGISHSFGRRQFSYDEQQDAMIADRLLPTREQLVPAFILWLLCTVVSFFVTKWLYLAATFGSVSTVILMFIFPSILYMKLKLTSDFQAIPICGRILPNQLYMSFLLTFGVLILLFELTADFYFYITGINVISRYSHAN